MKTKTSKLTVIWFLMCSAFVACRAPKDYYLHLSAMEKAGEDQRRENRRKLGEVVTPPEAIQPMVIALQPGYEVSDLIKMDYPLSAAETPAVVKPEPEVAPAKVPIGFNKTVLEKSLAENIRIIGIMNQNGRLRGTENSIQIHFVPKALSDEAIYWDFLLICQVVQKLDEKNTVDVVFSTVTFKDGAPYMRLKSKMKDCIAFAEHRILYNEWISRVVVKRYE